MLSINVRVSDLKKMVDELIKDNYEYVAVSILNGEVFEGDVIPTTLDFSAYDGTGGGCDYNGIEEIEVDPFYKFK